MTTMTMIMVTIMTMTAVMMVTMAAVMMVTMAAVMTVTMAAVMTVTVWVWVRQMVQWNPEVLPSLTSLAGCLRLA